MVCSLKRRNHDFAFLCMLDGSGGIIVNDINDSEQKYLCCVQAL